MGVVKVKQSVTLKGTKDGFVLTLDDTAAIGTIHDELDQLLANLLAENKSKEADKKVISLEIKTGKRLLSESEVNELTTKISTNSQFQIKQIKSDVLTYDTANEWHEANSLQMEIQTIRSGQTLTAKGDILLIGKVHPGGSIRADGSIFIIGELLGIAHAGFSGDDSAVVVADFQTDAQIRIADNIQIIENKTHEKLESNRKEFAYINDLHILEFATVEKLKVLRPKMDKVTGGLM